MRVLKGRLALLLFLLQAPISAGAQTTLEVESWCRGFATAEIRPDGMIKIPQASKLCWGAFVATQQLIVLGDNKGLSLLKVCPPAETTLVQLIKIFLSYSQ